jgi:hypothetical protein
MFRFYVAPVLTPSSPIGELTLSTVSWNDPVVGVGGTFEGKAEIDTSQTRDSLMTMTEPNAMALYVYDDVANRYLFGGVIKKRPWSHNERRLTVQAISWKSWLYQKLVNMNMSTNPPTDTLWSFTGIDQFAISRSLFSSSSPPGVLADYGVPAINLGTELSGVLRTLTFQGSQFKFVGELIDSMAYRDQGFDWYISVEPDANRMPSLWLRMAFPGRGSLNNQILVFQSQNKTGGNILSMEDPEDSSDETRTRTWATGSGTPPDQVVAFDEDPDLSSDVTLLTCERVDNYTTVSDNGTLASHARQTRAFYGQAIKQSVITVSLTDPDYNSYVPGDKIRLVVQDDWTDWDFDAVRIVDREFHIFNQGGGAQPDTVKLTIDLNDDELPEDEAQV